MRAARSRRLSGDGVITWAEQFAGDISIRANGMRTRAQQLTFTRGSRATLRLGREGNRNVQNFPRFGRGFVLRGDR